MADDMEPRQAVTSSTFGFDYQKEADRLLLGRYSPPGVLVNEHLDILQFRGHTGNFLEPASGSASLNLMKMAPEGLLRELRGAFNEARRQRVPARRTGAQVKSNDLVNFLNSVQIPIIILSGELRIRRFTAAAERLLNIIPTDVGRPLTDLRPNIVVPELERLITEVMESLTLKEVEAQDREGRWYSLRIRPYRTLENKIDGVILAFVDIDTDRRALAQAEEARQLAEAVVEAVQQPLLVLDRDLRVRTANRAYYEFFRVHPEDLENRLVYNLGQGELNAARLRELLERVLLKGAQFENFEMDVEMAGVGRKKLVLNARRVAAAGKAGQWILLGMEEARK